MKHLTTRLYSILFLFVITLFFSTNSLGQTSLNFYPTGVQNINIPGLSRPNSFTVEAMAYLFSNYTAEDTLSLISIDDQVLLSVTGDGYIVLPSVGKSTTRFAQRRWTHLSVSYDDNLKETRFYIEGREAGIIENKTLELVNGTGGVIGVDIEGIAYVGSFDDIRIWSTVRSQVQVYTNIESCLDGTEPGLHAFYNFNEGGGTVIQDAGPNGFNGVMTLDLPPGEPTAWGNYNRCFSGSFTSPCNDGLDNDGDGLIDCEDSDECSARESANACQLCGDGTSFADEVIAYNVTCLNDGSMTPDQALAINALGVADGRHTSLGEGGDIKLKFVDNYLANSGDEEFDLFVFEIGRVERSKISLRPANDYTLSQVQNLEIPDENNDGFFEFGAIEGSTRGVDVDVLIPGYRRGQLKFDAIEIADFQDESCNQPGTPGADINAVCALASLRITSPDLTINTIDFDRTSIAPGEQLTVTWHVENLGTELARGGWIEEVFLVSNETEARYPLGTTAYFEDLLGNFDTQREVTYTLPQVLGVDGPCKVEIKITPNNQIAEGDNGTDNNTVRSQDNLQVGKQLSVELDKTEIAKTAQDSLKVTVQRSGTTLTAQEFIVESSENTYFDLPKTVTVPINKVSAIAYIKPGPNIPTTEDQQIELYISGAGYPAVRKDFTLLLNEKFDLELSYDPGFSDVPGGEITFTLQSKGDFSQDRKVTIQSNASNRIDIPAEVVIPAGRQNVSFQGTIRDTGMITNSQEVEVRAIGAENVTSAVRLPLGPLHIPGFELISSVGVLSEGDGPEATQVTLKRTSGLDRVLQVRLKADAQNIVSFPGRLTLDTNEEEITFPVGVIENTALQGEISIHLTALVIFGSCNCTNEALPGAKSTVNFVILDNDGPSLQLQSENTTVAAASNVVVTLTRPPGNAQDLEQPLDVSLSTSNPGVITVPETVTIPAGQSSTTITLTTSNTISELENAVVTLTANAKDINGTTLKILVTKQERPDVSLAILDFPSVLDAGSTVPVKINIRNEGFATFPAGAVIDMYVSETNNIEDQRPIASILSPGGIGAGAATEIQHNITLPQIAGEQFLTVTINASGGLDELTTKNNAASQVLTLQPAYTIDFSLDKTTYVSGETANITGKAIDANNTGVPLAAIQVTIANDIVSRNFNVRTNADGAFKLAYTSLENESGTFTVTAAFPGAETAPQAQFDLLGFRWVDKPTYVKWEPITEIPLTQRITLQNVTSIPLRNARIQLPAGLDFSIDQTPLTIAPDAQEVLEFTITTGMATIENAYTEVPITIVSDEGAIFKETIYYYARAQQALLVAEPVSINTTMVKDAARVYEFTVRNIGETMAKNVAVRIPEVAWMQLKSAPLIAEIPKGESARISLSLQPTDDLQLNVPITGSLAIADENGANVSVPFRIEPVSELTGSLTITATDEYTYNTPSRPKLPGANVVVKRPYSGTVVAEGVTNDEGVFEIPVLEEGYYTIAITAEKHTSYQNNITVDPGKATNITAFLSYEAVTYTWDVQPTEVEDEYDITLITEFETNVPKPVVVMELDDKSLEMAIGETKVVNLDITNHGLIAANDVKINTTTLPGYEIIPSITALEVLNAKSAVRIPVEVRRTGSGEDENGGGGGGGAGGSDGGDEGGPPDDPQDTTPPAPPSNPGPKTCRNAFITLNAVYICGGEERTLFSTQVFDRENSTCIGGLPRGITGGGSGSGGGTVKTVTLTEIDLCDPCIEAVVNALLSCTGKLTAARCVYGILTTDFGNFWYDITRTATTCRGWFNRPIRCAWSIYDAGIICDVINLPPWVPQPQGRLDGRVLAASHPLDYIFEDFAKVREAQEATLLMYSEYFNNTELEEDEENLLLFINQVALHLDEERPFSSSEIEVIKSNLENTGIEASYIDYFTNRWNTTLDAWAENIFSPNSQYPDILDKTRIDFYVEIREDLKTHVLERGFVSTFDMVESGYEDLEAYSQEAQDDNSVCATVTLEFNQTATMTREAFEGTLRINNASNTAISDIVLEVSITDSDGIDRTDLFQVNREAFLNGGTIAANSDGAGNAIFIPTKAAAPQFPVPYNFGGEFSYYDEGRGERVTVVLTPITLEVNPSPDLILDYFVQRNILGDDPLTNAVEPSFPAELAVLINNDGFGAARNVMIASAQPEIVDNEKGLLIDFNITGSSLNNSPQELGLLNIDFGDIEPKSTAVGQWFFTSSLLGKFVSYELEVIHTTDYGNDALGLIKESNVHELIRGVRDYREGEDAIDEFLVNDQPDAQDTPDRIYFSDGGAAEVGATTSAILSNAIAPGNLTTTLTMTPQTPGWTYGVVPDPGAGSYVLERVIRNSDGRELPLKNFWQTFVTLPGGLEPRYEDNLHFLDNITGTETYTLHYVIKAATTVMARIEGIPGDETTITPVTQLTVVFETPIDPGTFTVDDLQVVRQGTFVDASSIVINTTDNTTFTLDLSALTTISGFYELDVSLVDIKDINGNRGETVARATWIQFIGDLGILKIASGQEDKKPLSQLEITFNKGITPGDDLLDAITLNGSAVPNLEVVQISELVYLITGLEDYNQQDGAYELEIDLANITATDGSTGFASQSYLWYVDTTAPAIRVLTPQSQATTNPQFVTQVEVALSEAIEEVFDPTAIQLLRDGTAIEAPLTIEQLDTAKYLVKGLGTFTQENGAYTLTIDQSSLRDMNNNTGSGDKTLTWQVNVTDLVGFGSIAVAPDLGISPNDQITSGDHVVLQYTTLEDQLNVEIYEVVDGTSKILQREYREEKGTYEFPLSDTPGNRRLELLAVDSYGNISAPGRIEAYIDFTDLQVEAIPTKINEEDACYGFDYVTLVFSEAIAEESLTPGVFSFETSGIPVDNVAFDITKMDDFTYTLQNITYTSSNDLWLAIDKTKIRKALSGKYGTGPEYFDLGLPSNYAVALDGNDTAEINETETYTVSGEVANGDWVVINGEIQESSDTAIKVKWLVDGVQSLMFRYQTSLGCQEVLVKNITVNKVVTGLPGVPDPTTTYLKVTPVPNNGSFTIHTDRKITSCTLAIFDLHGQRVYYEQNVSLSEGLKEIKVIGLSPGVYNLTLGDENDSNDKLRSLRFVIE